MTSEAGTGVMRPQAKGCRQHQQLRFSLGLLRGQWLRPTLTDFCLPSVRGYVSVVLFATAAPGNGHAGQTGHPNPLTLLSSFIACPEQENLTLPPLRAPKHLITFSRHFLDFPGIVKSGSVRIRTCEPPGPPHGATKIHQLLRSANDDVFTAIIQTRHLPL